MEQSLVPQQNETNYMLLDLEAIVVSPDRGRKVFDPKKIMDLAESIKTNGLIHPVVVDKDPTTGLWTLVAGERRYRAHVFLQMEHPQFRKIKALDHKYLDPLKLKEVELEENLHREQLTWPEQCTLLEQIHNLKKHQTKLSGKNVQWTIADTAQTVGESEPGVSAKIRMAKKLRERPDLGEKVVHMPMSVAVKEIERLEKVEQTQKQLASGTLSLSSNLLHGSAVELLKTLQSESVDLVLTDPPYGLSSVGNKSKDSKTSRPSTAVGFDYQVKQTDNCTGDEVDELYAQVFPELFRVLKPGRHCYVFFDFSKFQSLVQCATAAGFIVESPPLIWYKERTTGAFTGLDYAQCYEPLLFMHKPPRERRLNNSCKKVLTYSIASKEEKTLGGNHPFQKPLTLLEFLVEQSTFKTETVLDPFAGSASTLVAATKLGRQSVGFELDEERFLGAQLRLSALRKELGL